VAEPMVGGIDVAVPANEPAGAFAALRFPQYRLLWLSGAGVFIAVNAQGIARGWLARELTGTNAGLGGVMLGFGLPMLFATPWGGVAADRLSKRMVLVAATTLLVVTSSWIGLAVAFDVIEYWMLIVASGLQAIAFSFFGPARMAFIAELVDRPDLPNAVALGQMSAEATRVVGPALAGILIGAAAWGTQVVFLAGAAICIFAAVATCWLPPGRPAPGRPVRSPLGEIADGVRYARREPGLLLLVVTSLGVVMIGFPYMAFLPTAADDLFDVGSGGYGLMSAVTSIGAVVAGLALARRAPADPWRGMGIAGMAFAIGLVLLGLAPWFTLALLVLPLVGAAGLAFQSSNQSLLLTLSSFEYHGRLQSLVMLGFSAFGIAALPLGLVADAVGLRPTFVGMGLGVGATIAAYAARHRRDRHHLTVTRDFG
jgi:predicted MFS family arabinose efflux permease